MCGGGSVPLTFLALSQGAPRIPPPLPTLSRPQVALCSGIEALTLVVEGDRSRPAALMPIAAAAAAGTVPDDGTAQLFDVIVQVCVGGYGFVREGGRERLC